MIELFKDNLFAICLLAIWIAVLVYSVLKFGYRVWFKTAEFTEEIIERKKHAPKWFELFANSTTVLVDLWIARITSVLGFLSMAIILAVLVIKFLANIP